MMRPVTCLSLLVALGAGLYLYQEKHRAQLLDRDIVRTVKLVEQARERVGRLKAEKAVMEEPQRLAALVSHHLQLQPLAPGQFVRLEDLAARLPPAAAPGAAPADPPPAIVALAAPLPDPAPQAPPAAAAHPTAPRSAAPTRAAKPDAVAVARAEPGVTARPIFAPVMPAYAPTTVAVHAPTIQNASATMANAAPNPYPSYVGSALGMSRTALPAPVPVGAAMGAGASSLASGSSLGYAPAR